MGDKISSLSLFELRGVLTEVVRQAHEDLVALADALPPLEDGDRKRLLLQQLHAARQRLQRLGVVVGWSAKARAVAECRRVLEAVAAHQGALQDAADQLAYLHGELSWTNPPAYDVATAAHVTAQGTYDLLPTCVEEECGVVAQRAGGRGGAGDALGALDRIARGLARLEFCLRSLLLREPPPGGARVASVRAGVATVEHAQGLYRLRLTLVPAPSTQVTLAQYGGEGAATEVSKADGAAPAPAASADWRWRVLGVSLLPSDGALGSPDASALLPLPAPVLEWMRRSVEQQLWAAADVAALRAQGALSLVDLPPGSAAGRASASDLDRGSALSAGGLSALLSGSTGEGGTGAAGAGEATAVTSADGGPGTASDAAASSAGPPAWRTRPLALAHRLLSRAAARAAMGALIVPSLRELAATAPFEGHFRIERASATGVPAIRVQLWTGYPAWTAAELASLEAVQREGSADPGAHPDSNHGLADGGAPSAPLKMAATTQPSPLQLEIRLASPEEDSVDLEVHPSLPLALGGWSALQPRLPVAAADAAPALVAVTDAAAALSLLSVQRELGAWAKWARCRLGQAATAWADAGPAAPRRPLSLRLPRRARPRLEVWAAAEPAAGSARGRHSAREDRPDAVLAVDVATGRICVDAEQGAAGALAPGSSVRAALESALHAAEKEAAVGPLEPHHASRLHLRAELVARAVARHLQARAARRRLEAVHEAVAGLIGEESRADGALGLSGTTARWVPARLLATMAALDGAASGADPAPASAPLAVGALSIDLPCFSMRPFASSSTTSTAPPSQATAQSTGAVGVSLLVRSAPESESVSVDLLVQAATPSGVRLRTLHALRLTDDFCVGGADGSAPPTRRPHKGKRAREEVRDEDDHPESSAPMIDVDSETLANGDSRPGRAEHRPASLPALLSIARRARVWHQLLAQLSVVGLRAGSEEWRLDPGGEVRRVAVVAAPPGLARLDAWHRGRGGVGARGLEKTEPLPGQAHVEFAVDEEGRWEGSVPSAYFGALDAPANGLCRAVRGRGLMLSGSFARGESLVPAISGALAAVRLHLCLCRIRQLCAAREGRATDRASAPDAALKEVPNHAGFEDCRWRVPGSAASCRVRHADLATARFEVCRPTRAGTDALPASDDETVVMAISVSWLPGEEACAPSGPDKGAPAPHEPARWHATARASPLSQTPSSSSKGCRIVAEPAPPEDLCRGLKAALESGREAAFLDALCMSCPLGLDARRALLEPGRQRAAGLLPGALTRLERGLSAHAVLSVQIVHGLRALQLSVAGVAGGLTRLTLRRASDAGRAAAPPAEQASANGHQDAPQADPARASASGGWFADLIEHCRSVGGEEHAFSQGNGVDPGSERSDVLAPAPGASPALHRKLAALRSAAAAAPRQAVVWVRESDVAAVTMLVMRAVASGDADAPSQRVKQRPLAASE